MKIYTSYYAKSKNIPDSIVKISIAARKPKFFNGLEYTKISPKYDFFAKWKYENHDNNYYIDHFNSEVLNTLSPIEVYRDLEKLSNGNDCVLLCYEKSGDFCHRNLVADWLNKNLNIQVEEW